MQTCRKKYFIHCRSS